MATKPGNQDLREAYTLFERRLLTSFGLYAWSSQVSPRLERKEEIPSYLMMTENSIITGSLVCIRSLDDFFLKPDEAKFDHDIIAHDFGFSTLGSPLGTAERTRINRIIVHMSYAPIWDAATYVGPNGDGSFDLRTLLSRIVPRCTEFMDFLTASPLFSSQVELARIRKLRGIVDVTLGNVQRLAKQQQSKGTP